MFVGNHLTCTPGWDEYAQPISDFDDVRDIQKNIRSKGIKLEREVDEDISDSSSFIIRDPDGNTIMFYQHV